MAAISPTSTVLSDGRIKVTWAGITTAGSTTFVAYVHPLGYKLACLNMHGTVGTWSLTCSVDGTNYKAPITESGQTLAFTAAACYILDNAEAYDWVPTAGAGTSNGNLDLLFVPHT